MFGLSALSVCCSRSRWRPLLNGVAVGAAGGAVGDARAVECRGHRAECHARRAVAGPLEVGGLAPIARRPSVSPALEVDQVNCPVTDQAWGAQHGQDRVGRPNCPPAAKTCVWGIGDRSRLYLLPVRTSVAEARESQHFQQREQAQRSVRDLETAWVIAPPRYPGWETADPESASFPRTVPSRTVGSRFTIGWSEKADRASFRRVTGAR